MRGRGAGTAKASVILAGGTLFSQGFQFFKLLLVSAWFGASSGVLDGYFAALRWPLLFQGVLVGALVSAVLPQVMGYQARGQYGRAVRLFSWAWIITALGLLFVLLVGTCFPKWILGVSTPGFQGQRMEEAARMLPWCLLTMALVGLSDLTAAWYQLHRRFLVTALVPAFCLAFSIVYLVLFRHQGPMALVHGSALAGAVQLGLVLAMARGQGVWHWRPLQKPPSDLAPLLLSAGKMILILLTAYLAPLIDVILTSFLPQGNLSTLELSVRLHDVVVRLGVVSLATALFPVLGELAAGGRHQELLEEIRRSSLVSFLVLVPLGVAILLFGPYAVGTLFQRGRFHATDTEMVSLVWGVYSLVLCSTAGVHITARALQACQRYRVALGIGFVLLGVHAVVGWFAVTHLGLVGLPLAAIASQSTAYALSYWSLVWLHSGGSSLQQRETRLANSGSARGFACLLLCILCLWAVSSGVEFTSLGRRETLERDFLGRAGNSLAVACLVIPLLALYGFALVRLGIPGFRALGRRLGITPPASE